MRLLSLHMDNFGCFGKGAQVVIPPGLSFIVGENKDSEYGNSNGAGKTTIREALTWALYGRTTKGVLTDEVINAEAGKDCMVQAVCEINGKTYQIARYRKHKEHKNNVILAEYQGERMHVTKSTETSAMIEELIGIDYKTFINSIVCGHHSDFARMGDAEQKKMIENLFDISIYDALFEKADEELKEVRTLINEVRMKMSKLDGKIHSIQGVLRDLGVQLNQFEIEKEKKIVTIKNGLRSAKDMLMSNQEKLERLEATVQTNTSPGASKEDMKTLEGLKYEASQNKFNIQKADGEIKKLKDQLKKKESFAGKECPTCFTKVSSKNVEGFREHIEEEVEETEKEKLQYTKALDKLNAEISRLVTKVEQAEQARLLKDKENRKRLDEMVEIREVIARMEEAVSTRKEALRTAQASSPENLLKMKEKNENQITKFREEREELEQGLLGLLDDEKAYGYWRIAFSNKGIRNNLFEKILPFLNSELTSLANELCAGEILIKVSTQTQIASGDSRNKFAIQCQNLTGGKTYNALSRGEAARVNLCLTLALQRLVSALSKKNFDVLFYDEVFDALDEKGVESAIRILRRQTKKIKSILVTTHNQNFLTHHAKVIKVIKENKTSRIEVV